MNAMREAKVQNVGPSAKHYTEEQSVFSKDMHGVRHVSTNWCSKDYTPQSPEPCEYSRLWISLWGLRTLLC